jgi:spermidine synthase
VHLDTAVMPDGGGDLRLMQRGTEYSIMSGAIELMNSRLSGSEEALATLTAERIKGVAKPEILIGGFGMGFTLRAALAAFGSGAKITVAELVPKVLAWGRGPMAHISGECLRDKRVSLHEGDVRAPIRSGQGRYDAILLDVDNGPEGLTRKANDRLYDREGLANAWKALKPGGILGVWSSAPNDRFTRRLSEGSFDVEELRVRATGKKRGAKHVIWLATAKP